MKSPLITIYITNYNYEQFLRQSIESVLKQSLQDFDLLIIDDGSTDGSKAIIEEYRENNKVSIIYQQNKGLNITNNVAMRMANGKYIMRLDADDFLEPTALEVMSAVLEADEELGLVFPDYYYVDIDGNKTGEEKGHNFEKEVSLYDQPAHGACTMVRLEFLRDLGGYNESFTCQDGYDLWIKFIMHHKVTNVSQSLFSYRRHGNNLTTNEERILATRQKIKELFVNQHLQTKRTLCIIPVRSAFIGNVNWPLHQVDGKTILHRKVATCVEAKKIDHIIISSADPDILEYAKTTFEGYKQVDVIERPKAFSQANETLRDTIDQALKFAEEKYGEFEAIMTVSLEYPFTKSDIMDDAINTMTLFQSDAVLSVRPDNRMYYQHTGHTLAPILDQEKFTKLEREALYRGAGGIMLSTKDNFRKNKNLMKGKISHIVVDQKTAFGVFSNFDFEIFEKMSGHYLLQN
ncbi:glycosyltransferase [Fulvivirga sp.]|uniref:glycosyltransferase n=1 Tax=Fulvivirga sp. TaxID=1931237 RepID=UPI0032ECC533